MGGGEAIRGVGRIAWPGDAGLNNTRPGLGGRQPRPDDPSGAKTPGEALSYIASLYKSGRMEDLAKLLRRSQVFRTAWLIVQQSTPNVFKAAEGITSPWHQEGIREPPSLPVPATGAASLPRHSEPGPQGPEAAKEDFPPSPSALRTDSGKEQYSLITQAPEAAPPLTAPLYSYQNQDRYRDWEKQRGQLINLRA